MVVVLDEENRRRLSDEPEERTGVYKQLDDVPDRYRLRNHKAAYAGMDPWTEFAEERTEQFDSQATCDRYEKAGRYYKGFMSDIGRHHALARPQHLEEFFVRLHKGDIGRFSRTREIQTVYFEYFQPLDAFYSWLLWHTDHPHVYHPVRMAAIADGFAAEVWQRKTEQSNRN